MKKFLNLSLVLLAIIAMSFTSRITKKHIESSCYGTYEAAVTAKNVRVDALFQTHLIDSETVYADCCCGGLICLYCYEIVWYE